VRNLPLGALGLRRDGAVVERYEYGDFGRPEFLDANWQPLPTQASLIDNPYLFTGRRFDPETGLYRI
jgi:hypothetical protein